MKSTTFTFEGCDGSAIFARSWRPDGEVRGVVQIAHGMGEHSGRYARFAQAIVDAGYAVFANDDRGHGRTAASEAELGDFGTPGWEGVIDDIRALSNLAKAEHADLPFIIFGHSMGSFAVQRVILDHSTEIDAAVLCGTTAVDVIAGMVASGEGADLTSFNAGFAPSRTDFDWLSRDPDEVDNYIDDPHCGFGLNASSMASIAEHALRHADSEALSEIRHDLPIFMIAGSADPINVGLALVDLVAQRYRDAGLSDVTCKWYTDARHELLNETNRDEVTADVVSWLDRVTDRQ